MPQILKPFRILYRAILRVCRKLYRLEGWEVCSSAPTLYRRYSSLHRPAFFHYCQGRSCVRSGSNGQLMKIEFYHFSLIPLQKIQPVGRDMCTHHSSCESTPRWVNGSEQGEFLKLNKQLVPPPPPQKKNNVIEA